MRTGLMRVVAVLAGVLVVVSAFLVDGNVLGGDRGRSADATRSLLRQDIVVGETEVADAKTSHGDADAAFGIRGWQLVGDSPMGFAAWSAADYEPFLAQLAKLKFNCVVLEVHPWQPFVDYEFGGVRKKAGGMWLGEGLRIERDMPGRTAFEGRGEFENPDLTDAKTDDEMREAGKRHLVGVMRSARGAHLRVDVSIAPLEFPLEFEAAVDGLVPSDETPQVVVPGSELGPDDARLRGLVRAKLSAWMSSYPDVEVVHLRLPRWESWSKHGAQTLARLVDEGVIEKSEAEAVDDAVARSQLAAVSMLTGVLSEIETGTSDGGERRVVIENVDPQLWPILDGIVWEEFAVAVEFDDAGHSTEQLELLKKIPAEGRRCLAMLPSERSVVSPMSGAETRRLELLQAVREQKWDGIVVGDAVLGEADLFAYAVLRVAFDGGESPTDLRAVHDELFTAVLGDSAAASRLWKAFEHMQTVSALLDETEPSLTKPSEELFASIYRSEPLPENWQGIIDAQTAVFTEMYRTHGAADPRSRDLLYYYAKRSEYGLSYLNAVAAMREAAAFEEAGETEAAVEQVEAAVEHLHTALETLGDVVKTPSDRGLIAVVANYVYYPLVEKYEGLLDAAEEE